MALIDKEDEVSVAETVRFSQLFKAEVVEAVPLKNHPQLFAALEADARVVLFAGVYAVDEANFGLLERALGHKNKATVQQ